MRTTLLATAAVGAALLAGSVVMVAALRHSLAEGVKSAAEARAGDLAAVLQTGTAPGALALTGEDDEEFVQIVDAGGEVVAATANLAGRPPVASVAPGSTRRVDDVVVVDADGGQASGASPEREDFVIAARRAETSDGGVSVMAGQALEPVTESTQALARILVVAVPMLLAVAAATSWLVVGRALAPVEAMRREVAEISASALDRRVPTAAGDDEIARLAETLNVMLDRLDQAQQRQRRFVSDASHELRSPVASLRQHAEVAQAYPERSRVDDLASEVLTEADRLQRLVDDLLLVTRADEGTLRMGRQEVDVDDLVLEEARRLRAVGGVQVDTSAVSAGRVLGDPALLVRVLRNLGDNAGRHATGVVSFAVGAGSDGSVRIRVDDDGPGIPADKRAEVFERFVRLDDARTRDTGGSGLGLAIVAEVVSAHGGTVTAGESPTGGARLEVTLPAAG